MLPFYGNHYHSKAFIYVHCKCLRTTIEDIYILAFEQCKGSKSAWQTYDQTNTLFGFSIVVFDSIEPTMKPLSESSYGIPIKQLEDRTVLRLALFPLPVLIHSYTLSQLSPVYISRLALFSDHQLI